MKKSFEMPVRPVQEKKPTGPLSQKPATENKPKRESTEWDQKKTKPTEPRSHEVEGDEYEETIRPDIKAGERTPEEKPW